MAKQSNKVEKMLDKKLGTGLGMFEKDTPLKKLVRSHAQMIVGARSAPDSWQKNIMRGAIARAGAAKRAARSAGITEESAPVRKLTESQKETVRKFLKKRKMNGGLEAY
jgi:hypothetical protein